MTTVRATTIPACLLERAARSPRATAFHRRIADRWVGETWESVLARVRRLSGHLIHLGLLPGDRVVIMMPTSIEWEVCHLAALAAGCVVVGVDAHDASDNIRHIVRTVAPRALFVARQEQRQTVAEHMTVPPLFSVINGPATEDGCHSLPDLLALPETALDSWPLAQTQDLATIIFTSGSTGQPKGVAYTHAQLCLACEAILERFGSVGEGTRFACWLPLSNLFQRIINLCGMIRGGESYFVDNPTQIIERLPEIRPTLFIGVPRFFEKLHAGIEDNLAKRPVWVRTGVSWARRVGHQFRQHERDGRRPQRAAVGHPSIGRPPVPEPDSRVDGAGPAVHGQRFGAIAGLAHGRFPCARLARAGSLRHQRKRGSHRHQLAGSLPVWQRRTRPAAKRGSACRRWRAFWFAVPACSAAITTSPTEESPLDADGFLHTGDYARRDADGFIWLAGRKSEVFKTSTGRRVAPVPIEARLKQLPYVDYAVVFGRDRPVPVALLCVNPTQLPGPPQPDAPLPAGTLKRIADDLSAVCASLSGHDRPAGVLVTRETLSIARGELTSNLKLRRAPIEARYLAHLEALYAELGRGRPQTDFAIREVP